MNYKRLHAGDIRQKGDEVCRTAPDETSTGKDNRPYNLRDVWAPVRLLGHVILPSDTLVSSFRRPC